jgi:hypothetical protein
MPTADASPPQVFISYSHDSPHHARRVLELSERLRGDGIDARIDQHTPWPSEGWPRLMEGKLREASAAEPLPLRAGAEGGARQRRPKNPVGGATAVGSGPKPRRAQDHRHSG